MNPRSVKGRWLDVDEVRTVADLRVMHSKVDELYQICNSLQQRHDEGNIVKYADLSVLAENIHKVDELYLWFLRLREQADRRSKASNGA